MQYRPRPKVLQPTPNSFVLLTGCTGGLGELSAHLFAAKGWSIVLHGRNVAKLAAMQKDLASKHPTQQFDTLAQDLSVTSAADLVVEQLRRKGYVMDVERHDEGAGQSSGGREKKYIDVLVNNAGFGSLSLFLDESPATQQGMIDCHVSATTGLVHALLPVMLAGRPSSALKESAASSSSSSSSSSSLPRGRIAIVSSMISCMPSPRAAVYAATKSYLTSFATAVGYEAALAVDAAVAKAKKEAKQQQQRQHHRAAAPEANFAVTLVTPGATHTSFASTAGAEESLVFSLPGLAQPGPEAAEQMVDGILAGRRWVQPGALTSLIMLFSPRMPDKMVQFINYVLWGSKKDFARQFFSSFGSNNTNAAATKRD
jgi:short-subunit dehydrogenase